MKAQQSHNHPEAFCLMKYQSYDGKDTEIIWNSRDGVTPFTISLRSGACATHVEWDSDVYAPDHKLKPGDRYFADMTLPRACTFAMRDIESWLGCTDLYDDFEALVMKYYGDGTMPDLKEFNE